MRKILGNLAKESRSLESLRFLESFREDSPKILWNLTQDSLEFHGTHEVHKPFPTAQRDWSKPDTNKDVWSAHERDAALSWWTSAARRLSAPGQHARSSSPNTCSARTIASPLAQNANATALNKPEPSTCLPARLLSSLARSTEVCCLLLLHLTPIRPQI